MANENKRIIEIDGIKLEVDLRQARRVDHFSVGDRVKVLKREYSSTYVYHGVIVGFENFATLPTIVVAYVESSYSSAEVKIAYINTTTNTADKRFELVADNDETLPLDKASVLTSFDRSIKAKIEEIRDVYRKKHYFVTRFGKMFGEEKAAVEKNAKQVEKELAESMAEIETLAQ